MNLIPTKVLFSTNKLERFALDNLLHRQTQVHRLALPEAALAGPGPFHVSRNVPSHVAQPALLRGRRRQGQRAARLDSHAHPVAEGAQQTAYVHKGAYQTMLYDMEWHYGFYAQHKQSLSRLFLSGVIASAADRNYKTETTQMRKATRTSCDGHHTKTTTTVTCVKRPT